MRYIILIITFLLIYSCKVTNLDNKVFIYKKDFFNGSIYLKEDGSFIYNLKGDLINETSEGNWKINNNILTLKSYDKYKSGINFTEEIKKNDSDKLTIKVYEDNGDPLSYANIALDNVIKGSTNAEGIMIVDEINFSKVSINYLSNTYHYELRKKNINYLILKISLDDLGKVHFDHEKFVLKNKFIYWRNRNLKFRVIK